MINKIKFSNKYKKMPEGYKISQILDVWVIDDISQLSNQFLQYDTETVNGDHYKLPEHGKFIMIILRASVDGYLWTTIRSYTPGKLEYYKKLIGKLVECEIQ